MNEYVKQAKDFLESCNATMKITYIGSEENKNWNDGCYRNTYRVTIKTPMGNMCIKFWDSVYNRMHGIDPTEYDILACLQKYNVGTIEDFASEFGYDLGYGSKTNTRKIYKAVCKEYEKVCRCFTPEQIEAMREIQ